MKRTLLCVLAALAPFAAHAQVNDSLRSVTGNYQKYGFTIRYPDNWQVVKEPAENDITFRTKKIYDQSRPGAGLYCQVFTVPEPATQSYNQASLDAFILTRHVPTDAEMESKSSATPGMHAGRAHRITIDGHPALAYQQSESVPSGEKMLYKYEAITQVETPGLRYTIMCSANSDDDADHAYQYFQLSTPSIDAFTLSFSLAPK